MAQLWEHSPPTNVARVQIPPSTPSVGWVCCWFSPLLREVFSGYSGFPLSPKTNIFKFQFHQESVRRRTSLWMCYLQIVIYFSLFNYLLFISSLYLFSVMNPVRDTNSEPGLPVRKHLLLSFVVKAWIPIFCSTFSYSASKIFQNKSLH